MTDDERIALHKQRRGVKQPSRPKLDREAIFAARPPFVPSAWTLACEAEEHRIASWQKKPPHG